MICRSWFAGDFSLIDCELRRLILSNTGPLENNNQSMNLFVTKTKSIHGPPSRTTQARSALPDVWMQRRYNHRYMASKYTLPRHGLLTSKTRTPTAVQYTGFAMRTCYLKWCLRHASGHTTTTPTATPTMLNMWIFWNSEKRFWKSYGEQKTKTLGGDHSSSLGHVSVVSSLLKLDFRYLCSR